MDNNLFLEMAYKIYIEYVLNEVYIINRDKINIFPTWVVKVLQNNKCILGNSVNNIIMELTYDGDNKCFYIDTYGKLKNTSIKLSEVEKIMINN